MHGLIFLMSTITGQIEIIVKNILFCFRPNTITMFGLRTCLVGVIFGRMKKCEWKIWEKIIKNGAWLGGGGRGGGGRKLVEPDYFLSGPNKTLSLKKMRVKMRSKTLHSEWNYPSTLNKFLSISSYLHFSPRNYQFFSCFRLFLFDSFFFFFGLGGWIAFFVWVKRKMRERKM